MIGRPSTASENFSLLALAFSTSGFLGPVLAGFAIDGIGHANAMLALSVGALVNVVVLAARNVDIPRHEAGRRARRKSGASPISCASRASGWYSS